MEVNEFYQKFANTPLKDRYVLLKMSESESLTLAEVYFRNFF